MQSLRKVLINQIKKFSNFWLSPNIAKNGNIDRRALGRSIDLDKWLNLTYVWYGGSNFHVYLNGRLETSISYDGHAGVSSFYGLVIGKRGGINAGYFIGNLKDIRIYDTALTAEEVGRIYAETKDKYLAYE